jgi:hypothetical protein
MGAGEKKMQRMATTVDKNVNKGVNKNLNWGINKDAYRRARRMGDVDVVAV